MSTRAPHRNPQYCHCGKSPLLFCDYPDDPPHRFHRGTHILPSGIHYTYWEDPGEPKSGYRKFEVSVPLATIRQLQDRWPFTDADPIDIVGFLIEHALSLPPRGAVLVQDVSEP